MLQNGRIQLGLAEPDGVKVLKERVLQNLADVLTMMEWNHTHDIRVFCLSSDLFPHMSNPKFSESARQAGLRQRPAAVLD
jgi:UV DNA damage repair endonuclease